MSRGRYGGGVRFRRIGGVGRWAAAARARAPCATRALPAAARQCRPRPHVEHRSALRRRTEGRRFIRKGMRCPTRGAGPPGVVAPPPPLLPPLEQPPSSTFRGSRFRCPQWEIQCSRRPCRRKAPRPPGRERHTDPRSDGRPGGSTGSAGAVNSARGPPGAGRGNSSGTPGHRHCPPGRCPPTTVDDRVE